MKYRYTRYTGEDLEGISLEELVSKLSDLLLSSGFDDPYGDPLDDDGHSVQDLHDAILEALLGGGMLSDETLNRLLGDPADADPGSRTVEARAAHRADHRAPGPAGLHRAAAGLCHRRGRSGPDVGADPFRGHRQGASTSSGYRALRDLLGSVGKSSVGRHDTRDLSTRGRGQRGVQALRVRGHPQHRSERHDSQRGEPRRRARLGRVDRRPVSRPHGGSGRISELVRHGPDAGLQPQHDPVWGGSVHPGEAGRPGAHEPHTSSISR